MARSWKKEGLKDTKIIVWDHNRDMIYQRALYLPQRPRSRKIHLGIGFHWYEDWSGGTPYDNLRRVRIIPDKNSSLRKDALKVLIPPGTMPGWAKNMDADDQ